MIDDIKKFLISIGCEIKFEDEALIQSLKQKIEKSIMNLCNINEIQKNIEQIVTQRVCGEYLFFMKNSNRLSNFDIDNTVKQIQEGDVNIVFAFGNGVLTNEQRIDYIINYMINYGKEELISYRCLKW